MSRWEIEDLGCAVLIVGGIALAALLVGGLIVDTYLDRSAFAAQAECRSKRMDPMRQSFSTSVICVPMSTRQDTTTVNVKTP